MSHPLPLAAFPVADTADIDQAEAILSLKLNDLQVTDVKDRQRFRLTMNSVDLGDARLIYNRFGAETIVKPNRFTDHMLCVFGQHEQQTCLFYLDDEHVVCSPRQAVVLSPPLQRIRIARPAGSEIVVLRVPLHALERRYRDVTGKPSRAPLRFDRGIDLVGGVGKQLRRLVTLVETELRGDSEMMTYASIRRGLDDLLLSALLALPLGSHRDEVQGQPDDIVPGVVSRAESPNIPYYIWTKIAEPTAAPATSA